MGQANSEGYKRNYKPIQYNRGESMKPSYKIIIALTEEEKDQLEEIKKVGYKIVEVFRHGLREIYERIKDK